MAAASRQTTAQRSRHNGNIALPRDYCKEKDWFAADLHRPCSKLSRVNPSGVKIRLDPSRCKKLAQLNRLITGVLLTGLLLQLGTPLCVHAHEMLPGSLPTDHCDSLPRTPANDCCDSGPVGVLACASAESVAPLPADLQTPSVPVVAPTLVRCLSWPSLIQQRPASSVHTSGLPPQLAYRVLLI